MTAHVPNSRDEKRARVVAAAVWWVNDQACAEALADLEDAVEELLKEQSQSRAPVPMGEDHE